jgi:hypothetical protein
MDALSSKNRRRTSEVAHISFLITAHRDRSGLFMAFVDPLDTPVLLLPRIPAPEWRLRLSVLVGQVIRVIYGAPDRAGISAIRMTEMQNTTVSVAFLGPLWGDRVPAQNPHPSCPYIRRAG